MRDNGKKELTVMLVNSKKERDTVVSFADHVPDDSITRTNEVHEAFDFDQWIEENALQGIKHCLMDHHMTTLDTLDIYSTNALNMMGDERIKSKPHLLPILMSSVIKLKSLESQRKESTSSSKISPSLSPVTAPKSNRGRRSSLASQRRASATPFGLTILEDSIVVNFDDGWDNEQRQKSRRQSLIMESQRQLSQSRRKSLGGKIDMTSGVNSALSGLNIRDCKRDNFRMNHIDAYPQSIMYALQTGQTLKKNSTPHKAWIFNICFYICLILYIYYYYDHMSLVYLIILITIWVIYTIEWMSQMMSNSWKAPETDASNIYDIETICREMKRCTEEKPSIKWNVKCYHANKENQSGGRVETMEKKKEYECSTWKDISPLFPKQVLKQSSFTQLTIYKTFQFGNKLTQNDYYHRAELFRQLYDNKDDSQYFSHWMEIKGWMTDAKKTAKIVVQREKEQNRCCLSKLYLALFSCFMCSACYRTYASRKVETQHMEYIVLKEISL